MGCGASMSAEEKDAKKKTKELEKQMEQDAQQDSQKIKLLLLGAGESGKSTIFKQMKVLYGAPLTDEERKHFTQVVYSNVIVCLRTLLEMCEKLGFKAEAPDDLKESFDIIGNLGEFETITPATGQHIRLLWEAECVRKTWDKRSDYQIVESHQAYLNDIERIAADDYIATLQDVLLSRVRTSGIVTEKYVIDGTEFEMYDVGGQRNERKKWIHCFEGVTAVIFVAALSEYDQVLYEDATTNRMIEAVELFAEICNNRYFENSSMILFLNKRDLFAEKIQRVDIKNVPSFSDFEGGLGDYDIGCEYFLRKFLATNNNEKREVYSHVTCATDTANVQFVWNSCKDIILRNNLRDSGFI